MKKTLKTFAHAYNTFEERLLVASLVFTVLLIFVQVIMRYVFNHSLSWSEELARFVFIWQTWLGTSLSYRKKAHIYITLLTDKLHGWATTLFDLLANCLLLWFCVFLTKSGFELIQSMQSRHVISPAMQIPMTIVYFSLPISQLALSLRIIGAIITDIKSLITGKPIQPEIEPAAAQSAVETTLPEGGDA